MTAQRRGLPYSCLAPSGSLRCRLSTARLTRIATAEPNLHHFPHVVARSQPGPDSPRHGHGQVSDEGQDRRRHRLASVTRLNGRGCQRIERNNHLAPPQRSSSDSSALPGRQPAGPHDLVYSGRWCYYSRVATAGARHQGPGSGKLEFHVRVNQKRDGASIDT